MKALTEGARKFIVDITKEAVRVALLRYDDLLKTEDMNVTLFDESSPVGEAIRGAAHKDLIEGIGRVTDAALVDAGKAAKTDEDALRDVVKGDNDEVH